MSFLRKMYAQVRLDSDAVAADGDAYIVRAGCRVTSTAATYILTDNPGGLRESLYCYAVDASGNKITNSDFQINSGSIGQGVLYSEGDGAFKVTFSSNPPAEAPGASWARIVCNPAYTTSFVQFYQTDTAADTPLTEKIDLPPTGKIEGYVKVRDVDVIVDYNGNRTHIFDVSTEAREFVTPEDFGAVGDGTTDDARYIQNALDYLSFVTDGGELRLGPKTYLCTISTLESVLDGLKIRGDNVRIVGQGFGSIIKQGINATNLVGNTLFDLFLVEDGVTGTVFQDFQIDDSTAGTADGTTSLTRACIKAGDNSAQTASLRISGMKIRSFNKTAIYLFGCDGFTIINTVIGNNGGQIGGHGIYILDGTSTTSKRGIISSCQLYDDGSKAGNGAAGVYLNTVDRVMLDGCSIRGWDYGVHFAQGGASNDLTIDSCHIRNQSKIGIYTATASQVDRLVISGNTVDTCGEQGIYLDSSGLVYSPVIDGNTVSNTGKSGIVLDNCYGGVLSNNVVSAWNTDNDGTGTATKSVENGSGYGFFNAITGMNISGNVAAKFAGGAGSEEYAYGFATGATGFVSHGNSIQGSMNTADYYFETPANAASSSWLNDDPTTGDWLWGDPDGSVGRLKPDGSIDMGGGALDTEGGGILSGGGTIDSEGGIIPSGGGLIDTEGGNLDLGGGVIVNTSASFAAVYVSTPAATTITTSGTYYKVAGTTTEDSSSSDFTTSTDNRLQYTGTAAKKFYVQASLAFVTSVPTAANASFRIYKYDSSGASGATIAATTITRYAGSASEYGAIAIHGVVELDENDYIEIHCTKAASSQTITVGTMYLSAVAVS